MISMHTFHPTSAPGPFLRRWHRQHGWRMKHQATRRMQNNTHRWDCLHMRQRRETLLSWAREERDGYAACVAHWNRLPSNNDAPRSRVYWHMANIYARIALGEQPGCVIADEEAHLLVWIRAYNTSQERIRHTWHGYAGYYGEDEVKTKMLHAKHRMQSIGVF